MSKRTKQAHEVKLGQGWRSGWCKTRAEEAKVSFAEHRAAGAQGLFTASWSCHTHGISPKIPFLWRGGGDWGRASCREASPAPSGHCALSSPWCLPPQSNSIHQLIRGDPVENNLLYDSQEKQWKTHSFQELDSMVESRLQDIPWLHDPFLLDFVIYQHLRVSEATTLTFAIVLTGPFQAKNNVGAGTNEQKLGKEKAQLQVISHPHPEGSADRHVWSQTHLQ